MNNTISIGSFNFPLMVQIANDGTRNGGNCSFDGVLSDMLTSIVDALKRSGFGCTLHQFESIGSWNATTRKYSDMIGALFRNDIQMTGFPAYFPLRDSNDAIEYMPPFLEDTMTMMGVYNVSTKRETVDISYMYQSLPSTLWIGMLVSFATFTIILGVGLKKLSSGRRPTSRSAKDVSPSRSDLTGRSIWMMVSAFLSQPSFPADGGKFMASMTMATAFPIFFIMTFINSNVSTDLVVVDKPVTINSYQDVIDWDVSVLFSKRFPEWQTFAEAPKDSIQRNIFKNALLLHKKQVMSGSQSLMDNIINQRSVIIGRAVVVDIFGLGAVYMSNTPLPKARALKVVDANGKKYANVAVVNKMAPVKARRAIFESIQTSFEFGFPKHMYDIAPTYILSASGLSVTMDMKSKVSTKVEEQNIDPAPISISNIYNMITFYFILIAISLIGLSFEMERERQSKQKIKRQSDKRIYWQKVLKKSRLQNN